MKKKFRVFIFTFVILVLIINSGCAFNKSGKNYYSNIDKKYIYSPLLGYSDQFCINKMFIHNSITNDYKNVISNFWILYGEINENNIYSYHFHATVYLHSLIILGFYDLAYHELNRCKNLSEGSVNENIVFVAESLIKIKENKITDPAFYNEKIFPIIDDIGGSSNFPLRYMVMWSLEIETLLQGKAEKTLEILENKDFHYIFRPFDLEYLKARCYMSFDIDNAITTLESAFKEYYSIEETEDQGFWGRVVMNLERKRLLLAYLYCEKGNIEEAMKNFELALERDEGSTYIGNIDYWMDNRDYFDEEFEVMQKLKEMYLAKLKEIK